MALPAPRRYAEGTAVAVSKTKAELDELLMKHGATQRAFAEDEDRGVAIVLFRLANRNVRLEVKLPELFEYSYATRSKWPTGAYGWTEARRKAWSASKRDQGCREAWRRVLLVTKAKLELVADGTSSVEREFLADILLPNGQTVHQALAEKIESAYRDGSMPPLLPAYGGQD